MLHEYYLYKQTIDIIMKRKRKFCVLTRIRILVSTFHSKKGVYTVVTWTVPSTVWTVDTVISETPSF
jgi:hypothetical protein